MPRYEFECEDGHRFEWSLGFNEEPPVECPENLNKNADGTDSWWHDPCGASIRKVFSPPVIVFRGTGWARNDG